MPSCQLMNAASPCSPIRRKETGAGTGLSPTTRSSLRFGSGQFTLHGHGPTPAKDMLTTCPALGGAGSAAADASADAAPDNAPRDPARDVTPSGTPGCKNAYTNGHGDGSIVRNSPAEHKVASPNLQALNLGAGPRAPRRRQLPRLAAHAHAAGNAGSAAAAVAGHRRWLDNAGLPASAASAWLPGDTHHCNSAFAAAAAGTAARSL